MAKKDNSQFDKAKQEKPKLQPLISVKTFKSLQDIKNGDSFEEALRKLYLLMWENLSTDREQQEIDGLFEEEAERNKARQHQQILEALFSLKEDKRSRQQKRYEERKEKKAEEKTAKKTEAPKGKGEAPKTEAPKEAPKTKAEKPKEAPKTGAPKEAPKTAERVEKTAEPPKQQIPKQTTEAVKKEVAPAPKPSAEPVIARPAPSVPKVSTIAKIAAGVAIGAGGVFASSKAFADTMYPYAQKASTKLGGKIPPEAILGQWASESGGGKSVSAPYNYAGIKAGSKFKKGDYVLTEELYSDEQIKRAQASGESLEKVLGPQDKIKKKGREVTIDEWYGKGSLAKAEQQGKKWVQVKSYFAKFDDFDDFVDGYTSFLSTNRYAAAREATTAEEFGTKVAKAGYATNSADKYSESISNFVNDFKGGKLDSSSKENKELKKSAGSGVTIINNTNNNIVKGGNQETVIMNKPNDKPQLLQ